MGVALQNRFNCVSVVVPRISFRNNSFQAQSNQSFVSVRITRSGDMTDAGYFRIRSLNFLSSNATCKFYIHIAITMVSML